MMGQGQQDMLHKVGIWQYLLGPEPIVVSGMHGPVVATGQKSTKNGHYEKYV
jgi:hypothetical protein